MGINCLHSLDFSFRDIFGTLPGPVLEAFGAWQQIPNPLFCRVKSVSGVCRKLPDPGVPRDVAANAKNYNNKCQNTNNYWQKLSGRYGSQWFSTFFEIIVINCRQRCPQIHAICCYEHFGPLWGAAKRDISLHGWVLQVLCPFKKRPRRSESGVGVVKHYAVVSHKILVF